MEYSDILAPCTHTHTHLIMIEVMIIMQKSWLEKKTTIATKALNLLNNKIETCVISMS